MRIEFYNEYHLGDNVFHLTFLRKLCAVTNDNFVYCVNANYLPELQHHIVGYESRIELRTLEQRLPSAINAWIGEIYYQHPNNFMFDWFYVDWFNYLTTKIYGETFNITLVSNYLPLSKKVDGYDYLVINSVPCSGQFAYYNSLDATLQQLSDSRRIITTKKVPGVECTLDYNMNLIDIGTIASNSDNIIAINTGPISTCLNQWAIKNVKSWVIAANNHSYSFPNVTIAKDMNELVKEIDCISASR